VAFTARQLPLGVHLAQHGQGLEFRPEHWSERSAIVKSYTERLKPYWWNAGAKEGAYQLYPEDYQ